MAWLETTWRDVCYACRSFARTPGFSLVAVLTIALGVGATTAIFSTVNAVLLKPLPYRHSDRIVRLVMNAPESESPTRRPLRGSLGLSADELQQLQLRLHMLSHVGSANPVLRALRGTEDGARLQGSRVSSTVFGMLEASPFLGRLLRPEDEAAGAAPAIVVSYAMWQRFFDGDSNIVGRSVTLDSVVGPRAEFRYDVVGVMPRDFEYPNRDTQFWIPFQALPSGAGPLRGPMVARLADGASIEAATAEIVPVLRDVRREARQTTYELVREQDELVQPVKRALWVLMGAVGFVLLIACVNVANLLLARTSVRQREIAIRTAIGAGRGRLVRQMLTESVLLALAGGAAGTGLALAGVRLLRLVSATMARVDITAGPALPRLAEIGVDADVLAFTLLTSLFTGTLFGLVPAVALSPSEAMNALRSGASTFGSRSGSRRHFQMRHVLVVAEVALAMVLLVGAGLLIGSFARLSTVDPGYRAADVLTFQVSLPLHRYPDSRLKTFAEDLVDRLRAVPGVQGAAYANQLPLVNIRDSAGGLWTTPDAGRATPSATDARLVSRDYLQVMGIRVVAGRGFDADDIAGRPRVVLVNRVLVNRQFNGDNPIGRTVFVGRDVAPWHIVGVVDDVRQAGLDRQPEPQFFIDLRQWSGSGVLFPVGAYYAVRASGELGAVIPHVRRIVRQLDDQAALFNVDTMEQLVDGTLSRPRMYAVLVGVFAATGVLLALVGIYGVVAYFVTERTREIGIRMSLGAQRSAVLGLVVRQGLVLAAIGVGVGVVGAAVVSRSLEGMLFGLTPLDLPTFLAVSLVFLVVAAVASYLPARRATNLDPLAALRHE